MKKARGLKSESGFSVIEALVAITFAGIIGVAMMGAGVSMTQHRARTIRNSVAMQLAMERMEEFGVVNPESLSDADDDETIETVNGIQYTRTVDVTVNADRTREVSVVVAAVNDGLGGNAEITNSFALWGTR